MALPIQATPKLNRKQTIRFLNRLWDEQHNKEIINIGDSVRKTREKRHEEVNNNE